MCEIINFEERRQDSDRYVITLIDSLLLIEPLGEMTVSEVIERALQRRDERLRSDNVVPIKGE